MVMGKKMIRPIPGTKNVYRLPVTNQRTGESPRLVELVEVKHETITAAEAQRKFGWMGYGRKV